MYTTATSSLKVPSSWLTSGNTYRVCVRVFMPCLRPAYRHFMHDPEVYKDPMTFNPDRLIAKPGKPAEPDPFDFAFGYGRR